MAETFHKSGGNVFEDIGFTPAQAAELTAKSMLITAIGETIGKLKLTQKEAARRCRTGCPIGGSADCGACSRSVRRGGEHACGARGPV